MKVLIAVGGGGHFSPALAVIERMPKDWEVLLVGRKHTFEGDSALSLEYQTADRLGLRFEPLITGRLQRKFTKRTLISAAKMPVGLIQATVIFSKFKPDVILSFGGYISVPVVLVAAAKRLPIVIHEQTLGAGLSNKIASRFATKICVSWDGSKRFFPKEKTIVTGNPLRKTFFQKVSDSLSLKGTVIYITGGSGGAHGINVLIERCLKDLVKEYTVIHQTGDAKQFRDFERLEKIKKQLPPALQRKYELRKFIEPERVIRLLNRADLVISRSGINTVSELLYLGKPCLLIPLPYGQHNEQLINAEFVKKIGLAEIIDQLEATPEELLLKIRTMISHLVSYAKHKEEATKLIFKDSAEKIIQEVRDAYEKEKRIAA